jgi:anti-sigma regulatory factor (Ser/Thr protein kinase)
MTGGDGSLLEHQAFFYASPERFAAAMAPVVRDGLERGDSVFVVAKRAGVEALGDALGRDADEVQMQDTARWYPRPRERLAHVKLMIDAVPAGRALLALGEPLWRGSDAAVREWARYESIINLALAGAPLRFICLYDSAELQERILDYGRATHPELLDGRTGCACDAFVDPERFVAGLADGESSPRAGWELPLDGDPHTFRETLAARAGDQGMRPDRVGDLVVAAHEVATNALTHGLPPRRARCWRADGELVCEIADSGPGLLDPLAGWTLPDELRCGGFGLTMARQLCDAVEIAAAGGGTRVRLHVAMNGAA